MRQSCKNHIWETFTILFLWEPCITTPLASIFLLNAASCCGKSNFKFKYLHEVEAKDEKILGYESGGQVGTSDKKNRRSKVWRYCPFKESLFRDYPVGLKKTGLNQRHSTVIQHQKLEMHHNFLMGL